jgi:hypothetical protein
MILLLSFSSEITICLSSLGVLGEMNNNKISFLAYLEKNTLFECPSLCKIQLLSTKSCIENYHSFLVLEICHYLNHTCNWQGDDNSDDDGRRKSYDDE